VSRENIPLIIGRLSGEKTGIRNGAELSAAQRVEAERSTLLIDPLNDAGKSRVCPYSHDGASRNETGREKPARFEKEKKSRKLDRIRET